MSSEFDAIYEAALQLPPDQQHELLRRLSIQLAPPGEWDERTWRMIDDRRAVYEAGKTSTLTWDQVKERLDSRK